MSLLKIRYFPVYTVEMNDTINGLSFSNFEKNDLEKFLNTYFFTESKGKKWSTEKIKNKSIYFESGDDTKFYVFMLLEARMYKAHFTIRYIEDNENKKNLFEILEISLLEMDTPAFLQPRFIENKDNNITKIEADNNEANENQATDSEGIKEYHYISSEDIQPEKDMDEIAIEIEQKLSSTYVDFFELLSWYSEILYSKVDIEIYAEEDKLSGKIDELPYIIKESVQYCVKGLKNQIRLKHKFLAIIALIAIEIDEEKYISSLREIDESLDSDNGQKDLKIFIEIISKNDSNLKKYFCDLDDEIITKICQDLGYKKNKADTKGKIFGNLFNKSERKE